MSATLTRSHTRLVCPTACAALVLVALACLALTAPSLALAAPSAASVRAPESGYRLALNFTTDDMNGTAESYADPTPRDRTSDGESGVPLSSGAVLIALVGIGIAGVAFEAVSRP